MAYKNIDSIIINTACNLFAEKGFCSVSVNEICGACSITKPTFYYHFKSKEDIVYEFFRSLVINSSNMIAELDNNDNDGKTLVIKSFELIFSVLTSKGYDMTQSFISSCLCDISRSVSFPKNISDAIKGFIAKGQNDGSILNPSAPLALYNASYHLFVGYVIYWCQHNGLIDEGNTLENALMTVL